MKNKVSVIAPYYNEKNSIEYTLNQIKKQTLEPDEVIFINSNSDDCSSSLIDKFIIENNMFNWKNYNTKLKSPSEAKNYGIQKSNNDLLAFMDFDIEFPIYWLELQIYEFKVNSNLEISYGLIDLNPSNYFDKLVIAQTYGINSLNPVIPSSIIKKTYFENHGKFLPYRSSYDKFFIEDSFKFRNHKVLKNNKIKIKYLKICYAKNFKELFFKTINYHIQSFFFKTIIVPIIYLLIFYVSLFLIVLNIKNTLVFLFLSFCLRGFYFPYKKNKLFFKKFKISQIPNLFFIGLFIDLTRIVSYHMSLFLKLFNKKIRFDKYYK